MRKILNVYKPIGSTPLEIIKKVKNIYPELSDEKIGYAGRLDPMARGVLLLMIGEETKNRDQYLGLEKEYEFEVLFGVSTDTYDTLGISNHLTIQPSNNFLYNKIRLVKKIKQFTKSKIGKHTQLYPPYSSIEVNGKPLFEWARESKLDQIQIPKRMIEIYEFDLIKISHIPIPKIKTQILMNIKKVNGDFRQKEILKNWEKFFSNNLTFKQSDNLTVAAFKIHCSSGTYVRSLAHEMGEMLGTGAIALDIKRTRVGKYKLAQSEIIPE